MIFHAVKITLQWSKNDSSKITWGQNCSLYIQKCGACMSLRNYLTKKTSLPYTQTIFLLLKNWSALLQYKQCRYLFNTEPMCRVFFSYTRPGGIFNNWLHVCNALDLVNTKYTTLYINGEFLGAARSNIFIPMEKGALLILGRDQDSYGGSFTKNDVFFGRCAAGYKNNLS